MGHDGTQPPPIASTKRRKVLACRLVWSPSGDGDRVDAERSRDLLLGEIERPPQRLQEGISSMRRWVLAAMRLPFFQHLRHPIAKLLGHRGGSAKVSATGPLDLSASPPARRLGQEAGSATRDERARRSEARTGVMLIFLPGPK